MVVKADGSKWACSSCLKGHRVSGCNHTDRELTLVPKKGRPVTQCHHCRLERKKRSAHVKCDCGETEKMHHPKEKCIHLREAEERAKAGFHDESALEKDSAHLAAVAEEQGCCCHHGGKCTCALIKKESVERHADEVPHGPAVHKPRLEPTKSEGSITVFANGHHKPVHRKNNAAHESGMPYKMPMPRAHTDHAVTPLARRSVDSLAHGLPSVPFNTGNVSKSVQHSPKLFALNTSANGLADNKLSTMDFNALAPTQTNQSIESIDSASFPALDPMSGIDCTYDPWSAFPSSESLNLPNNNPFGAWATTFDSGAIGQPALTAGSSGTQSDIDEIPPMDEIYNYPMPSIAEDSGFDATIPDGSNSNRRSLPPNFFGNTDFSSMNVNDWQMSNDMLGQNNDLSNLKPVADLSNTGISEPWPALVGNTFNRSVPNGFPTGRPQSHSIGPGSAPNDDIIRQLFPDIDVATASTNATSPDDFVMKRFNSLPHDPVTSRQLDFGTEDASVFTSQPWTDGSISVPSDAFNSAFGLEQEFSASDFSSSWSQPQ